MYRFFCPDKNISTNTIIIDDKEQIHHARDVLRIRPKDKAIVFDDKGNEYDCIIEEISSKVVLSIKNMRLAAEKDKTVKITVACAMAKKSKIDEVIDKLTQLGLDRVIPLETERVVVKLDKNTRESRLRRWRKIALNASQQSQRSTLMVIEPIKNIKELLAGSQDYDLKLIPTLSGERKPLKEILAHLKPRRILILIGPEGDFTPEEVSLAKKCGCIPVSLGDLVLRVETAAVAIVSYIRFSFL